MKLFSVERALSDASRGCDRDQFSVEANTSCEAHFALNTLNRQEGLDVTLL